MALKFREELVGKRFLAVKDCSKEKSIAEWEWRAGVVRAVLQGNAANKDLQVLIEFDGVDWQLRESVRVHDAYHIFMVEKALVWARRPDSGGADQGLYWPALNFIALVDKTGAASSPAQPIEFFVDNTLDFQEEKAYCCQDTRPLALPTDQPATPTSIRRQAEQDEAVRRWLEYQDGQSILLTTPSVLVGYRVKVYRTEGTTQWYTAVIQQYNHVTKKLTILDDTVLEEHNEDPAITQIVLLDGVVESILKGIDQRIIPRRRACNARDKEQLGGNPSALLPTVSLVQLSAGAYARSKAAPATSQSESTACSTTASSTTESLPEGLGLQQQGPLRANRKAKLTVACVPAYEYPKCSVPPLAKGEPSAKTPVKASSKTARKRESNKRQRHDAKSLTGAQGSPSALPALRDSIAGPGISEEQSDTTIRSFTPSRQTRRRSATAGPSASNQSVPVECPADKCSSAIAIASQIGGSSCREWKTNNDFPSAGIDCDLALAGKLPIESAVSSLVDSDMHYKKLHLLRSSSDIRSAGSVGVTSSAELEKTGNASPVTASEPTGGNIDKLSDCGSADAGSTSGYSSATVDTMSPRREHTSVITRTDSAISATPGDGVWPSESQRVATGSRDASRAPPFNSVEPVQVYRDPELLKKDEEARRKLAMASLKLQADAPHQGGSITTQTAPAQQPLPGPPVVGHLPPGHQAAVAAQHRANAAAAAVIAMTAGGMPSHLQQQLQHLGSGSGRSSAQQLLSSAASQHHIHRLEAAANGLSAFPTHQMQQLQLFQQQQELAVLAQLQMLWPQKFSGLPSTVPWPFLAYPEELFRSYRDRDITAGDHDHRVDRPDRDKVSAEKAKVTCAATVPADCERKQCQDQGEGQPKEYLQRDMAVKAERECLAAISATAESAVNQHFSDSLRLANKKAGATPTPVWQPAAVGAIAVHKPPSAGYGFQGVITEKPQSEIGCAPDGRQLQQDADKLKESLPSEVAKPAYSSHAVTADIAATITSSASKMDQHRELIKDRLRPMQERHSSSADVQLTSQHMSTEQHDAGVTSGSQEHGHRSDEHSWASPSSAYSLYYSSVPVTACMANNVPGSCITKQEPNFSLYGFQPFLPTYISQDKLHRRLDRSGKEDQGCVSARSSGDSMPAEVKKGSPLTLSVTKPDKKCEKRAATASPEGIVYRPVSRRIVDGHAVLAATAKEVTHSADPADGQKKHCSRRKQHAPTFLGSPVQCTLQKRSSAAETAYPYQHLIQEGLVPNPIYSQAALLRGEVAASGSTPSSLVMIEQSQRSALSCAGARAVAPGMLPAEGKNTSEGDSTVVSHTCAPRNGDHCQPAVAVFGPGEPSGSTGVIRHSFKSILESAMQKAYLQDLEEDKKKERQSLSALDCYSVKGSSTQSATPCDGAVLTDSVVDAVNLPPTLSPNGDTRSSGSSRCSRVLSAPLETDSDTLSAPSPPMSLKNMCDTSNDSSRAAAPPLSSQHNHHPKLKKAWLQRHSGEGCSAGSPEVASRATATHRQPSPPLLHFRRLSTPPPHTNQGVLLANDAASLSRRLADKAGNVEEGDTTSSASEAEAESRALLKRKGSCEMADLPSKKPRAVAIAGDLPNEQRLAPGNACKNKRPKPVARKTCLQKQSDIASPSTSKPNDSGDESNDSDSPPSTSHKKRRKEMITAVATEKVKLEGSAVAKVTQQNATVSSVKPLVKLSISQLKKTGLPFLQDGYCCEVTPRLQKCRECKMTPHQRSKKMPNIFCRFYAFRRLRFSQRGILTTAGFSQLADAEADDLQLWLPCSVTGSGKVPHGVLPSLDLTTAKYIIANVGDEFCKLVEQEKECRSWANPSEKIMWKRAVQGVRETCDVCDTTLFNMHWVCQKCGFVVCMDCYGVKRSLCSDSGASESTGTSEEEKNERSSGRKWLTCSCGRQPHDAAKMTLTQIIPGDALFRIGDMIHDVRKRHGIKANCPCGKSNDLGEDDGDIASMQASNEPSSDGPKNGVCQQLLNAVSRCYPSTTQKTLKLRNGDMAMEHVGDSAVVQQHQFAPKAFSSYSDDPLSLLADVASMDSSSRDRPISDDTVSSQKHSTHNGLETDCSPVCAPAGSTKKACQTLRKLLLNHSGDGTSVDSSVSSKVIGLDDPTKTNSTAACVAPLPTEQGAAISYSYYQPRSGAFMKGRSQPVPICQLTETSLLYPDVPHSWLCEGRLLRLHDPRHGRNFTLFNQRWKLGQPVVVSSVTSEMEVEALWSPAVLSREFGHMEGDLVNCRTGVLLIGHRIKDFWDGFENPGCRIKDVDGQPMLLKLKDWPPGEDFSDLLPSRFKDLMTALPMPEYTRRDGYLNLASRLPDFFVKPDLGPKMYNAYGMAKYPHLGTTNLHLDISDAVNVMVYVAHDATIEADVMRCIEESDVDAITRQRLAIGKEVPGALWHIWDACDADKIRDLLNKVAVERGEHVEPYHDPIHDQSWYLDNSLRDRLRREYSVHGFAIVQCAGDALFIPAGAPHQVQNLNSCIKVAEDFVSPEHLHHCFKLTQEFRHLSETHSNHEDKLQVKNIIYHAVKDAVAVLSSGNLGSIAASQLAVTKAASS